jgi:methionyl-tRNA synthetase
VVKPLDLADRYGLDAFRYFLIRDSTLGRDADFSTNLIIRRYNADLSNNLGNLLHRLTNMIGRYAGGQVPYPGDLRAEDTDLQSLCLSTVERTLALVDVWRTADGKLPNEALAEVMDTVGAINRYLEQTAPWKVAKAGHIERVHTILYTAAEALRLMSILLHPVLPTKIEILWDRLGWHPVATLWDGLVWGELRPGTPVVDGEPLFPRIE